MGIGLGALAGDDLATQPLVVEAPLDGGRELEDEGLQLVELAIK